MSKRYKSSSSFTWVRLLSFNTEAAITGSPPPRKGFVPILVGTDQEGLERFSIPVKLINHPFLVSLLDESVREFGYNQQGLLRVSCDVGDFKEMLKSISTRKQLIHGTNTCEECMPLAYPLSGSTATSSPCFRSVSCSCRAGILRTRFFQPE